MPQSRPGRPTESSIDRARHQRPRPLPRSRRPRSIRSRHAAHRGLDDENPGFVSLVVLSELHWVLRRAYNVSREDVATVVRRLLDAREITVQEPDAVRRALNRPGPADFPDALISELGLLAGCDYTATFDRRAARLSGMKLVPAVDRDSASRNRSR